MLTYINMVTCYITLTFNMEIYKPKLLHVIWKIVGGTNYFVINNLICTNNMSTIEHILHPQRDFIFQLL